MQYPACVSGMRAATRGGVAEGDVTECEPTAASARCHGGHAGVVHLGGLRFEYLQHARE
ncbi:MAG: hypothetical protein ACK55I_49335 [bacterium]